MGWNGPLAKEPSWSSLLSWMAALLGISTSLASMPSSRLVFDGLKILVIGSVIETGRRVFHWMVEQLEFRYAVSAEFEYGDISYGWLVNYLMTENVWHTPRKIYVKAKSSQRKWKFQTDAEHSQVDYVPDFGAIHFFRWKGYWLEVSRFHGGVPFQPHMEGSDEEFESPVPTRFSSNTSIALSIYTRDKSVLFAFVKECRLKYLENTKSDITVHSYDSTDSFGPNMWTNVKTKRRRPLNSLLLDEGMIKSLLADAREFLKVEDWYVQAGIPHRRGYLLHGPPGTGKTSTVYTLAGELSLEIYALSLSSRGMDDGLLARLVALLPAKAILLIEDIDCAFPSREKMDEETYQPYYGPYLDEESQVTMSGLLNVLDGLGSEEGKLFFATTNHIDRLDPALMRPGRIDRKVEYNLASRKQAHGLFMRFFLAFNSGAPISSEGKGLQNIRELADEFATSIPESEFSMAELQGYLLDWKRDPDGAARGIDVWVESERAVKKEGAAREQLRKERAAAARAAQTYVGHNPVTEDRKNGMNHGLNSRTGHKSTTLSGEVFSDADADPGTQTSGGNSDVTQKQVALGPSMLVNDAKDSPREF